MAVQLNDNIKINAGKPVDSKYLNLSNVAYVSIAEAIVTIPISERHIGLTVNVAGVEYFWKNGVNDTDLVIKETQINLNLTGTGVTMTVTHAAAVNQPLTGAAVAVPDLNSAPTNGDTILCYAQTVVTQNGIYVYNSAGSWTRSTAMDNISEVFTGMTIKVDSQLGNNKDAVFMLTSKVSGSGALGSLPLVFTKLTNNASNYSLPNRITGVDNTIIGGYGNSIVSGTTFNTFAQPVSVINGYNNTITGTSASAEGLTVIGLSGQSITWNSSDLGNTVMVPALRVANILSAGVTEDLNSLFADVNGYVKIKPKQINHTRSWQADGNTTTPQLSGWRQTVAGTTTVVGPPTQSIQYATTSVAGNSAYNIGELETLPAAGVLYKCFVYINPVSTSRFFAGLKFNNTPIGNVNPSTLTDTIYFGYNLGDTTFKIGRNDNTGTATIIDTGINLQFGMYYIEIESFESISTWKYFVQNTSFTSFQTSGSFNTDVPQASGLSTHIWINNGVTAASYSFQLMYQEMTYKYNG